MPLSKPPVWECHRQILKGGLATFLGKFKEAKRYLDLGEKLAREAESDWGIYTVTREKALLARAQKNTEEEKKYALEAYRLAKEGGWPTRVKNLEKEFQIDPQSSCSNGIQQHSGRFLPNVVPKLQATRCLAANEPCLFIRA